MNNFYKQKSDFHFEAMMTAKAISDDKLTAKHEQEWNNYQTMLEAKSSADKVKEFIKP